MNKIEKFAQLLEEQRIETLVRRELDCEANLNNCKVNIRPGKKYTKVDVGSSGAFMVDGEGNIFGIKGYGTINKKKPYGNLNAVDRYYWGGYTPVKKQGG